MEGLWRRRAAMEDEAEKALEMAIVGDYSDSGKVN